MTVTDDSYKGSEPFSTGRITNETDNDINTYHIVALYRNDSGRVINMSSYLSLDTLEAGETASFETYNNWYGISNAEEIKTSEVIAIEYEY